MLSPNISPQAWEARPVLRHYAHLERRVCFQFPEATYELWSLFAAEEGTFHYEIGEQAGEATFGDLVLCPPGIPFARKVVAPLTLHFFQFDLKPHRENDTSREAEVPMGKITLRDSDRLISSYRHLRSLAHDADRGAQLWREHLLMDLWLLSWAEAFHPANTASSDPLMSYAKGQIQKHAFENLQLKALAAMVQLSPGQFTRRFRAAFGINPSSYVTFLRLQKASQLLLETHCTLEEIAEQCGYENGFYLSRVFTRKMKMSPSIYRRVHRV